MRRLGRLLVCGALLLVLVAPVASAAPFGDLAQQSVDPDVVVMTTDVDESGDAVWTVAYRIRLQDANDTEAFESLQADIETNQSAYTERFGDRMRSTAATAENATGREMAIENVSVAATQETFGQQYGVITYRFEWTNFAATEGDTLVIGDAIAGLFLDSETTLTIRWPADYTADTVAPTPDEQSEGSATWQGQQQFRTDEPRIEASPGGASGAGGLSPLLLGGLAVAVVAVAGAAWALRERGAVAPIDGAAGAAASESDGDDGSDGGADSGADQPPAELLSNEEQVLQLLEQNGGRIKQQAIASDLDWTAAKTSQVIGGLRDEGRVETFRIGRENVVTLPDVDVTDTDDGDADAEPDQAE